MRNSLICFNFSVANTVIGCRGRTGHRKTSNMADSTELFELESFAIKKVEIFA